MSWISFHSFYVHALSFTQMLHCVINRTNNRIKSEVDSANASGTQALTLRGLSNPVLRLGVVYSETVSSGRRRNGGSAHDPSSHQGMAHG